MKVRKRRFLSTLLKFFKNFYLQIFLFLDNAEIRVLAERAHKPSDERWYTVALQVLFPFFMAGFGMVGAGVFLDKVTVSLRNGYGTKF